MYLGVDEDYRLLFHNLLQSVLAYSKCELEATRGIEISVSELSILFVWHTNHNYTPNMMFDINPVVEKIEATKGTINSGGSKTLVGPE